MTGTTMHKVGETTFGVRYICRAFGVTYYGVQKWYTTKSEEFEVMIPDGEEMRLKFNWQNDEGHFEAVKMRLADERLEYLQWCKDNGFEPIKEKEAQ